MPAIFDELINSFIVDEIGIAHDFLSASLSHSLRVNLLQLKGKQQLLDAGTGNASLAAMDKTVRSDKIHWLDPAHHDPHEDEFFVLIDSFVRHLNQTCYTGITGYEFHYTLYEPGSFYRKHLDQFKNNKSRAYSMIMYLNTYWKEGDGGELCIHHAGREERICPVSGKCVFFKSSDILHEVLLTHQPRLSITGWLKT